MKYSELTKGYIFAMVHCMYTYEASLINDFKLLTDQELRDFYSAYLGYPL